MNDAAVRLEKKLSPLNVMALAFGCIIGWGAFVMPANTFLPKAGPLGTLVGMALAALVMIVIAFNYNYMIVRYPIAGGEFTYAQKSFGNDHAFVCAWFLGLSYATLIPLNVTALALIGRNLLGNIFQVGFHYTVAGYDVYLGEIVLAVAAVLLFGVLSVKGVKLAGSFQLLLTIMLIGGVLIIGAAALVSPKATLGNLSPAFNASGSKLGGMLAVLAVAPWAFVGFDTVPQAAEEFNFPPKRTKLIMVVSILFGAAVYVILNTVTAAVVPDGFASWSGYIESAGELSGLESLPTFHAAYQLLGNAGLLVIGLSVLGAILSGIIGFYMAASRLLYSLANENVLPTWFGELHPKTKTPYHAIAFLMVLSLMAPFFGRTALGWLVDMSSLGAAIGYAYNSAAAFKHAKANGDKAIMATGLTGTMAGILFAILLLVPIPGLDCSLGKESYVCLAVWTVLGIVFYVSTKKRRKLPQESRK